MTSTLFGFGALRGTLVEPGTALDISPDSRILVVETVAELLEYSSRVPLAGAVIFEPVSYYSHQAADLWRLGYPVIAGAERSVLPVGEIVMDEFNVTMAASPPSGCEVWPELDCVGDLSNLSGFSRLAVINADDLVGWKSDEILRLAEWCEAEGIEFPPVRFFDSFPGAARNFGMRGARLLREREAVESFARLVGDLPTPHSPILVLPVYAHSWEFEQFRALCDGVGDRFGVTIETPEAALCLDEVIDGCSLVEIGLNDLSQCTVAWDRDVPGPVLPGNAVSRGVGELIRRALSVSNTHAVPSCVGLDLPPQGSLATLFGSWGASAISAPAALAERWLKSV